MALTDVSGTGSSGSFTDGAGTNITYTSDANHSLNFFDYGTTVANSDGSGISEGVAYTFSDGSGGGVQGLAVAVIGMNANSVETIDFIINGVDVNLQTLIDNGDAQLVPVAEWPASLAQPEGQINPTTGNAESSGGTQDSIIISFNFEITTLTLQAEQARDNTFLSDIFVDSNAPVCFTRGTLIKTDQGERPIEQLAAGDMVLTMDHGYQPIRWIGSSKRAATGDLAPILIRKGALGNDRDLRVSPQHRMLLQGWQAEMLFVELEVLATAKSLLNDQTILRDEGGEVEYFHMLFDTHEIIYAEGCPSESFHPGQQGWKALDQATRDEILTLFPQLADGNLNDYGPAARMSLKHKEGKLLGSYMAGSC